MGEKRKRNGNGESKDEQRIVKLELLCDLTEKELEEKGAALAKADLEINRLKDEARAAAASFRESVKLLVEERDPLAEQVDSRKEKRLVECVEEAVFERGVVITKRRNNGEQVSERPLEAEERERMAQGHLPWGEVPELPEKAMNDVEEPRPQPAA